MSKDNLDLASVQGIPTGGTFNPVGSELDRIMEGYLNGSFTEQGSAVQPPTPEPDYQEQAEPTREQKEELLAGGSVYQGAELPPEYVDLVGGTASLDGLSIQLEPEDIVQIRGVVARAGERVMQGVIDDWRARHNLVQPLQQTVEVQPPSETGL